MDTTAVALLGALEKGEIRSEEVTENFLKYIRERDEEIKGFLLVDEQGALKKAREVDEKRQKGHPLGKLAGLPLAIKDNICIEGQKTTCASKILENFVPPYDAHVVSLLKKEDAVLIGKTNLDEFGMGSSNENSAFQITRNPWDLQRTPGGSSGGSAAVVASEQVPFALGTDTGGSIRLPASFCGIVGMKPTYGRVSRYGLIAYGSSLDQIGPLGRTIEDVALVLEVISGHDSRDSTSIDKPVPAFSQTYREKVDSPVLAIPK